MSVRLCRNKVLEKGNLIECSKLFRARLSSYLCSSKFVFLLFSYLLLLVGSCFPFPFRLFGCIWNDKTIASGFNPQGVSSYPRNRKIKAIIADYLVVVSSFALHHHSAIIVCACLCGAWVGVCFAEAENVAAVVGVNKVLSLFGVVVDCFHCFGVFVVILVFSFSLRMLYLAFPFCVIIHHPCRRVLL